MEGRHDDTCEPKSLLEEANFVPHVVPCVRLCLQEAALLCIFTIILSHIFATKYDQTNPTPRTTTVPDDHGHGDATRLHCEYDWLELCSSHSFYLEHARLVSPQNTPLIKSLAPTESGSR
jgi:hypothetical protein